MGARVVLVVVGALAAGGAVAIRPRSAAILGSAALAAFLASVALSPAPGSAEDPWDSARRLAQVLTAVAAVAAVLLLLPRAVRRTVVSLVILFHFGGIVTAVTAAQPSPWLSGQIWTYIYRPYLYFMYLNNAYHFYSPEPGPASLLWFRIEYENDEVDGQVVKNWRWVKVPYLDKDTGNPVPWRPKVDYTRRLSLAESTNQPSIPLPEDVLNRLAQRRVNAGQIRRIPTHPDLPLGAQFREPNQFSKYWMGAYARHVACTYPHEEKPHLKVTGVKIYRVVHRLPDPQELTAGLDIYDPATYWPFYQGDYDAEGKMKPYYDLELDGSKRLDRDPFLYWLIPIARFPSDKPKVEEEPPIRVLVNKAKARPQQLDLELRDYLSIHAGDTDGGK
jgi:hypothetical protein